METMDRNPIEGWIANGRAFVAGKAAAISAVAAAPQAALIAAADLPLDPLALTGAAPGALYEIRTVAGLVPPSAGADADRAVGAALEFAVQVYGVQHVIVIAQPACGLVRCLIDADAPGAAAVTQGRFLPSWTAMAASALTRALRAEIGAEERARLCSQELVRVSFENLMTYPWVLDGVFAGRLQLHGWYIDPDAGTLACFDPASDSFEG